MKSKKSLPVIIFLFLLSHFSRAQNNMEDVVYLKNGSIIHGTIVEQIPNETIKIQTADKNVFVYKMDEVSKITKEALPGNGKSTGKSKSSSSGTFVAGDFGFAPGVGDISASGNGQYAEAKNDDYIINFDFVVGGRLAEGINFGLGVGFDKYKATSAIPLFIDFRADLAHGDVRPILIGDIGYAFEVGGDGSQKGKGLMINPAFGIKFDVGGAFMNFTIGYRIQTFNYNFSVYGYSLDVSETANFLTLKLGISSF